MKKKKSFGLFLTVLPLYFFTLCFVLGPLLYMIALSFATRGDGSSVVWNFTLDNYRKIGEPVYLQSFVQSFQLAFTSTGLIILLGYPFGYYMAKLSPKWKKRMMLLIMVPFWISSLIRMYGWIIILQAKGVLNRILMKLGILEEPLKIVYSSAEKMDWSLLEAARDLGANGIQAFFTVTFKLTLPGLLTGIILTFIPSMGLFFIADILGGNKIVLVGSVIQDQLTRGSNWPFAAALAVVLMVLTSLMILVYRKVTHVKDLEGLF